VVQLGLPKNTRPVAAKFCVEMPTLERTLSPTNLSAPPALFDRLALGRIARSIEVNGLRGAIAHSYHHLRSSSDHAFHGVWLRACAPPELDMRESIDLSGLIHDTDSGGHLSRPHVHPHSAASLSVAPSVLSQAISNLPLYPDRFTFIDLACGYGRSMLVAAQFPFGRILGVDSIPALCAATRVNIASIACSAARTAILNQDAATITYPDSPLVILLSHPFAAPMLRRVLTNLERQFRRTPRETYLLYARNPRITNVLDHFPFLHEIADAHYPLSPEDAAIDRFNLTHQRLTVSSATLLR
jgi:hypothetical protein